MSCVGPGKLRKLLLLVAPENANFVSATSSVDGDDDDDVFRVGSRRQNVIRTYSSSASCIRQVNSSTRSCDIWVGRSEEEEGSNTKGRRSENHSLSPQEGSNTKGMRTEEEEGSITKGRRSEKA